MAEVSDTYWQEVDRLQSAIIESSHHRFVIGGGGLLTPRYEHRMTGWHNPESQFVSLNETQRRLLGHTAIRYTLTLTEQAPEDVEIPALAVEKELDFHPGKQRLRVYRSMIDTGDLTDTAVRELLWGRHLDRRKGLAKPEQEDYDLLLEELQRGSL